LIKINKTIQIEPFLYASFKLSSNRGKYEFLSFLKDGNREP